MDPALQADVVATVHLGVVYYLIGLQLAVLVGAWRGWAWTRSPWLRWPHLAIVVYLVFNAVRGELCFLTHWEADLRREAGQTVQTIGFFGRQVRELLYVDIPIPVLNGIYVAFGVLVVVGWLRWPPRGMPWGPKAGRGLPPGSRA